MVGIDTPFELQQHAVGVACVDNFLRFLSGNPASFHLLIMEQHHSCGIQFQAIITRELAVVLQGAAWALCGDDVPGLVDDIVNLEQRERHSAVSDKTVLAQYRASEQRSDDGYPCQPRAEQIKPQEFGIIAKHPPENPLPIRRWMIAKLKNAHCCSSFGQLLVSPLLEVLLVSHSIGKGGREYLVFILLYYYAYPCGEATRFFLNLTVIRMNCLHAIMDSLIMASNDMVALMIPNDYVSATTEVLQHAFPYYFRNDTGDEKSW